MNGEVLSATTHMLGAASWRLAELELIKGPINLLFVGGRQQGEYGRTGDSLYLYFSDPFQKVDVNRLRSGLDAFLADPDCAKFLEALIAALPSKQGETERFDGTLSQQFERIKNFDIKTHVKAAASFDQKYGNRF